MKEIPDYQTLMLPVLKSVADGKEHKFREIADSIAKNFGLTEEELRAFLTTALAGQKHISKKPAS